MKISRSSWHYRLYRFICNVPKGPRYLSPFADVARNDPPLPKSLCPYAWSILLGLIGAAVVGVLVLVVAAVVVPVVLAARFGRRIDSTIRRRRLFPKGRPLTEPKPPKPKRESLVAAYVKARKNRVCPPIKLED